MTCIVGYIEQVEGGKKIWMGADSAGVSGWSVTICQTPKVFLKGAFILAYTHSFRMGQLLHYGLEIPEHPEEMSVDVNIHTLFVEAVRKCLKDGGNSKVDNNHESGCGFLVGYRGRLFLVQDDFAVIESQTPFEAMGSGQSYALGALEAIQEFDRPVCERVIVALKVAERRNMGVRGPFLIEELFCPDPEKPDV